MAVSQADFIRALHDLGVEIHHRGHTYALRFDGRIAYLPILPEGAPWPIKRVRYAIEDLRLDKELLSKRLPDLFGKPSKP